MMYLILFEELCSMHEAYSIVSSARFCFLLWTAQDDYLIIQFSHYSSLYKMG